MAGPLFLFISCEVENHGMQVNSSSLDNFLWFQLWGDLIMMQRITYTYQDSVIEFGHIMETRCRSLLSLFTPHPFTSLISEIAVCTSIQEVSHGQQKVTKWQSTLAVRGLEPLTFNHWHHDPIRLTTASVHVCGVRNRGTWTGISLEISWVKTSVHDS